MFSKLFVKIEVDNLVIAKDSSRFLVAKTDVADALCGLKWGQKLRFVDDGVRRYSNVSVDSKGRFCLDGQRVSQKKILGAMFRDGVSVKDLTT